MGTRATPPVPVGRVNLCSCSKRRPTPAGARCPRTSVCAVDQRNKIMQIVCFFKSDLHGTPRIATRRIVPRELPSNAKYCHSQRSVGTIVKYKRHTAMSIHAWRPSSAQSTRGQIDCSYFPPSRRGLIRSPIPSSDIIQHGLTDLSLFGRHPCLSA